MSTADAKPKEYFADVTAQRVARVYAEALFKAADKAGARDEVHEELTALIDNVFNARPELEQFLACGAIGRHEKARVLRDAFEHKTGDVFFNFLMILNEHERLDLLRPILTS